MSNNIVYKISAINLLSPALKDMETNGNKLNTTMKNLQGTIAAAFSVAAITTFTNTMLDAGTKVENARIGLTTILKDHYKAQSVINKTMEDAQKTPFEFEGLLKGNQLLISAGVSASKARQDVLNLANAIAATGGGNDELMRMAQNLQQIKNAGKATAADVKQFAYAGINLQGLLHKLPATYENITMVLKKAKDEGGLFYHGLENMQGSVTSQMSNVKDAIFGAMSELFVVLRPQIIGVVHWLQDLVKTFGDFVKWLERNKTMFNILISGFKALSLIITIRMIPALLLMGKNLLINSALFLRTGSAAAAAAIETEAAAATMSVAAATATLGISLLVTALISAIFYAKGVNDEYNAQVVEFRQTPIGKRIYGHITALEKLKNIQEAPRKNEGFGEFMGRHFFGEEGPAEKQLKIEKAREASSVMKAQSIIKLMEANDKNLQTLSDLGSSDEIMSKNKAAALAQLERNKGYLVGTGKYSYYKNLFSPSKTSNFNTPDGGDLTKSSTAGVSGPKITTINIKIENMVKDFTVQTTNMKEGATEVKDIVTRALTMAINDSQQIVK